MPEVPVELDVSNPPAASVPAFMVELESWPRAFISNLFFGLRELSRQQNALRLESTPGIFWSDVFVPSRLPWPRFLVSLACHVVALAVLVSFSDLWSFQTIIEPRSSFDRVQVVTYEPARSLPPLDTRLAEAGRPRKADPEIARQPVISLPPEADNRYQTIVTPPAVKVKRDIALPNLESWSDQILQRPQLAVPPAPVVLASSITRIAPRVSNSVVAPPPDLNSNLRQAAAQGPQAVIEPPPDMRISSDRRAGDLNIGHAAVIAPAPQLAVEEQRIIAGGAVGLSPQVVPPPPAASGYRGNGVRIIALNVHPTVTGPNDPPAGNRRGTFAATPEGHRGASGTPGVSGSGNKENGNGTGSASTSRDVPPGHYVGKAADTASPMASDAPGKNSFPSNSVNPRLLASLPPPSASHSSQPHLAQPEAAKLSDAERAVFGDRKFYSLTLSMPNLNSAGGSWIIRFAEIKPNGGDSSADSAGLSAPAAIRKVDPAYPMQLMHENVAGTVIVYAVIHADGSVGAVRILSGVDDRLDPFASQAIRQWQFRPATKNGAPVEVEATFHIPFRPSRMGTSF